MFTLRGASFLNMISLSFSLLVDTNEKQCLKYYNTAIEFIM